MKTTGETFGFDVIMRLLPVMEEQAAGCAMINFLFIAFYHPAIQYKSEISVLVIMPVYMLVCVFGIGERKAAMRGRFVGYAVKLACLQCVHRFKYTLNTIGFDGVYT